MHLTIEGKKILYGLGCVGFQKRCLMVFKDRKGHLGEHIPRRYRKTWRQRNKLVYQRNKASAPVEKTYFLSISLIHAAVGDL